MNDRRSFCLRDPALRDWVASFVKTAPLGVYVDVRPEARTTAQNKALHALIADAVRAGFATDTGERLDEEDAKTAFVTGWMIHEGIESKVVAFRGRPVQLRRSTTTFSKAELSSLMEFIYMSCAERGIVLKEKAA